jgi:hypothetical protein
LGRRIGLSGPLLIISGEQDHTVPWAIANASYKQQGNLGVIRSTPTGGSARVPP